MNEDRQPHERRRFTVLGCGSSGGVPRVGNAWGDCDPAEPRNRRRRCALLVEQFAHTEQATTIVVDAGADLREQLLGSTVRSIDGVLLTHSHADHIFGLDDLRQLALQLRRPIDVHMDAATSAFVMRSFGYCFKQAEGSSYPAFCREARIRHPEPIAISGPGGQIDVTTIDAEHGDIHALGFRFGGVAYIPDIKRLADDVSLGRVQEADVLIVDALRRKPHPSHFSLDDALALIEQCKPGKAILTNLHSDLDYATLRRELPAHVEPAYDGLTFELPG